MADKTQYEDGTEKEKYGIVGENFKNFNIADFKNLDFNAALEGGFMMPPMKVTSLGLKHLSSNTASTNRKTVSLQYTEVPAISQALASNKAVSVQPFLFGQFNGTMLLSPETDYWVSETLKPEVITVPERIIENHTVIREIVVEQSPPITITLPPSVNAAPQIIVNPNDEPPPPLPEEEIIVSPPNDPPPVIVSEPVPPEPVYTILPVDTPNLPIVFDFDPWWSIIPRNPFMFGGSFDGSTWFPAVLPQPIEVPPIIESSIPTALPPISLQQNEISNGGGGRDIEMDFLNWRYDLN
jgi:hypothetical protein